MFKAIYPGPNAPASDVRIRRGSECRKTVEMPAGAELHPARAINIVLGRMGTRGRPVRLSSSSPCGGSGGRAGHGLHTGSEEERRRMHGRVAMLKLGSIGAGAGLHWDSIGAACSHFCQAES